MCATAVRRTGAKPWRARMTLRGGTPSRCRIVMYTRLCAYDEGSLYVLIGHDWSAATVYEPGLNPGRRQYRSWPMVGLVDFLPARWQTRVYRHPNRPGFGIYGCG